jgi:hypothetical protein
MVKKAIKKGKKVGEVINRNKLISSLILFVLVVVLAWFYWADIVKIITEVIPHTLANMYEGFKKNWLKIGLALFVYKFIVLVTVNLAKRFAINKSMDRIKKSLIYSEMDELLSIAFKIKLSKIKQKIDTLKNIPFVGWIIAMVVNFISAILAIIVFIYFLVKTGMLKFLLGKVFSAQFWTGVLTFVMNIPGFFIITGLFIWLWLEKHLPWIPRFYFWVSMKVRVLLDPIWDSIVVPFSDYMAEKLFAFEQKYIKPIGVKIDILEDKIIHSLKEYIFKEKGAKAFMRYIKIIKSHNAEQLEKKRVSDAKHQEMMKKLRVTKIKVIRELIKKRKKKEGKNRD